MVNPVIILAHGAWFASFALKPIVDGLQAQGFDTWCKDLPTSWGNASASAVDDIAYVREAIQGYVDQGRDVVVGGWSAGTWTGPGAVQNLTKPDRAAAGQQGGVVGLVFMSAPVTSRNGSNGSEAGAEYGGANGGWYSAALLNSTQVTYGPLITLGNPDAMFYQGLPWAVNRTELTAQLRPTTLGALSGVVPYVPRTEPNGPFIVPAMFVSTRDDFSTPTYVQDQIIAREGDHFDRVLYVPGSHLVGFNHPDLVVKGLVDFAKSVHNRSTQ